MSSRRKQHFQGWICGGLAAFATASLVYLGYNQWPRYVEIGAPIAQLRAGKTMQVTRDQSGSEYPFNLAPWVYVKGTIRHNRRDGSMTVSLADGAGAPVDGLLVTGRITARGNAGRASYLEFSRGGNGRYKADGVALGKGRWNLAITAKDPDPSSDRSPTFRVEKVITVD